MRERQMEGGYDLVRSCVRRVRHKLGDDAAEPRYVITVRGVGYRLRDPAQWEGAHRRMP